MRKLLICFTALAASSLCAQAPAHCHTRPGLVQAKIENVGSLGGACAPDIVSHPSAERILGAVM